MKFLGKLAAIVCAAMVMQTAVLGEAKAGNSEQNKDMNAVTFNIPEVPEWKMLSADTGGTLLFSDSPEIVNKDGILYQDTVEGKARLLYYHLNGTGLDKKLVVLVENTTNNDSEVVVSNYGIGGPSEDYLYVGKTTQIDYFKHQHQNRINLPAFGTRFLSNRLDQIIIQPKKLVYGVFDFEAKVPVKVTVMMLPVNENALMVSAYEKVLPKDKEKLRGTYTGMDRVMTSERIYNGNRDGVVAVTLADGKIDTYRTGIDGTDGKITVNYGNYGVLYKIHIPTAGTGKTNYYMNPCGGVYAGAISVRRGGMSGIRRMVETPMNRAFFGAEQVLTDITYIGTYDNQDDIWFEFSPAGASNLPIRLIMEPAN